MTDTPETSIPGERGQTSAARKVDSNPLLKRGAVVLAVVAFMGFAMWSMRQGPKEDVEQPGSGVIRQTTEFEPARAEPEPVALPVPRSNYRRRPSRRRRRPRSMNCSMRQDGRR